MSTIRLEIIIDTFDAHPIRLPEDQLAVHGSNLTATIDLTHMAAKQGGELGRFVQELETILRKVQVSPAV